MIKNSSFFQLKVDMVADYTAELSLGFFISYEDIGKILKEYNLIGEKDFEIDNSAKLCISDEDLQERLNTIIENNINNLPSYIGVTRTSNCFSNAFIYINRIRSKVTAWNLNKDIVGSPLNLEKMMDIESKEKDFLKKIQEVLHVEGEIGWFLLYYRHC